MQYLEETYLTLEKYKLAHLTHKLLPHSLPWQVQESDFSTTVISI